jgi:hypothetical protein
MSNKSVTSYVILFLHKFHDVAGVIAKCAASAALYVLAEAVVHSNLLLGHRKYDVDRVLLHLQVDLIVGKNKSVLFQLFVDL